MYVFDISDPYGPGKVKAIYQVNDISECPPLEGALIRFDESQLIDVTNYDSTPRDISEVEEGWDALTHDGMYLIRFESNPNTELGATSAE